MRRIVLVVALTVLLVAISVAGSAFAQSVVEKGCEGLVTAVTAQEDAALPPNDKAKGVSKGVENSVVQEKAKERACKL
jgi:competence protein ComGC